MDSIGQLLAPVFVLGLLAAALCLLRRRGGLGSPPASRGQTRRLERIDRLTLSPHHSLHIVVAEGREFLIAVHPSGCNLIRELGAESGKKTVHE